MAAMVALRQLEAAIIMVAAVTAVARWCGLAMAAPGCGPIAGCQEGQSPQGRRLALSPPPRRRPGLPPRHSLAFAGIIPIPAKGQASGTPVHDNRWRPRIVSLS